MGKEVVVVNLEEVAKILNVDEEKLKEVLLLIQASKISKNEDTQ